MSNHDEKKNIISDKYQNMNIFASEVFRKFRNVALFGSALDFSEFLVDGELVEWQGFNKQYFEAGKFKDIDLIINPRLSFVRKLDILNRFFKYFGKRIKWNESSNKYVDSLLVTRGVYVAEGKDKSFGVDIVIPLRSDQLITLDTVNHRFAYSKTLGLFDFTLHDTNKSVFFESRRSMVAELEVFFEFHRLYNLLEKGWTLKYLLTTDFLSTDKTPCYIKLEGDSKCECGSLKNFRFTLNEGDHFYICQEYPCMLKQLALIGVKLRDTATRQMYFLL